MTFPRHSPRYVFFFVALLLVLARCHRARPSDSVFIDFAASLDTADVQREVDDIEFGTAAARTYLREGWSGDEKTPAGHPFVWSDGDESILEFFLASVRRPLSLVVRCRPLELASGSSPQRVEVTLNGTVVAEFVLEPRVQQYDAVLPADALSPGRNRLRFRYAYTVVPAESIAGARDVRRLAVAWHRLRLRGAAAGGARDPSADAETSMLRIPLGVQLDYYLRLPEAAQLTVDSIGFGGGAKGSVAVLLQPDGEAERVLGAFEGSSRRKTILLDRGAGTVTRLSFRALAPARAGGDEGSVRLVRPVLRGMGRPASSGGTRGLVAAAAPRPDPAARPHVFLYLVDALRADHLGCYGYGKPVSPNIDAFAAESTLYRGIAQSSWTKASVASIFTGLSPIAHGVQRRLDKLPPDAPTLSKLLGGAGYRTLALHANGWIGAAFGVDQGFEDRRPHPPVSSPRLHADFVAWLDAHEGCREPLFAYVHTVDPHAPYAPPEPFRTRFASPDQRLRSASVDWLRELGARKRRGEAIPPALIDDIVDLYDAEIAFNDVQFGLFVAELKRRGLYDDALVLFTADHGEEFFEKDSLGHGLNLSAQVLDIPLIVKWPRRIAPTRRSGATTAQHVDILPTILDCLGLPPPEGIEGRSLLPYALEDGPVSHDEPMFSYLDLDGVAAQSVIEGRWKLVRVGGIDEPRPRLELFDRNAGDERTSLSETRPVMARYLLAKLERHAAVFRKRLTPTKAVITKDLEEQFRALGYIR